VDRNRYWWLDLFKFRDVNRDRIGKSNRDRLEPVDVLDDRDINWDRIGKLDRNRF